MKKTSLANEQEKWKGSSLPPLPLRRNQDKWKPVHIEFAMTSHPLVKLTLADEITTAYIEMNGRTYYIDDSTGGAIMDNWAKGEGRNQ